MEMRRLWEFSDFVRSMRRRMRFGEFSRAPLRLLRVELRGETAECDWIARTPDIWDDGLRRSSRDCNESLQALADAIAVRDVLFDALPHAESAVLRAFRQPAREAPELVILGTVSRESPAVHRVSSLVMRAKLYGFCFCLEDGFLRPLQQVEEQSKELIAQSVTQPGQGGSRNGGK
jgi:hypothetical protein